MLPDLLFSRRVLRGEVREHARRRLRALTDDDREQLMHALPAYRLDPERTAVTAGLVMALAWTGLEPRSGWVYTGFPILGHVADGHWAGLREPRGDNEHERSLDRPAWMYVVKRSDGIGSPWLLSVREASPETLLHGRVARIGAFTGPAWNDVGFTDPLTVVEAAFELLERIGDR